MFVWKEGVELIFQPLAISKTWCKNFPCTVPLGRRILKRNVCQMSRAQWIWVNAPVCWFTVSTTRSEND